MEQNVDEITNSYEIIDKTELDTADIDACNNNNNNKVELEAPNKVDDSEVKENDDNNNQSGNRKYTRDELIKLKQAITNPAPVLKDSVKSYIFKESTALDRTLDRSKPLRSDAIDKMMPFNMPNMPNNRNSYQKQRSVDGRRSAQGNRSQSSSLIKLSLQSNDDVKLNEAANAWKPQMLSNNQELSEEEQKTAELKKQFRSILNKITPENFTTLIGQLKGLKIDNVEILDSCISLVFEKAILEPNFGASYAQLCKEVSDVFVVPLDENNSQQKAVFKKRLITQCQREFEKHRDNELVKNNVERLREIDEEEDSAKKEELKTNYEAESFKIRRRAVGTVHFIGELYKIEMLTSRIMQSCIQHLLEPSMCSEETLECLCKLLTTIGKRLEQLDSKKIDLTEYFATLSRLADKKNSSGISSRIRFMIQDLIELRLNNWTPRKLQRENKPSTMDEIKKQVKMEQYITSMDNKEASQREKNENRGGQNERSGFYQGGSSGNNKRGNVVSEDGWSTQYSKSRPLKLDMSKIIPLKASEEVTLGAVPSFANFGNRFSGLKEEEPVPDQSNRAYTGRFSGGGQNMNQNQNRNQFGNNRGNRNNNNNNNRSAGSRSLQPPNLPNQKQQQQQFGASRKISQQNMPLPRPNDFPMKNNQSARKISAPARTMNPPESFRRNEANLIANVDQVTDSMKKLLKAYQSDEVNLNEAVEKLKIYKIGKEALVIIYNWSFDQHDKERFQMTEIICEGFSRNIIMSSDLLEALKEIIEIAQDLACDLPKIYNYIGQLLALPLLKRIVQVKDLLTVSKQEIEANNGGTVLKNVFTVFEQKYQKEGLKQLYTESGVDFQSFLDSETKLDEFLKENNFDYLTMQESNPEPLVEFDETTRQKLEEMLKNPDVDAIIVWIEHHIMNRTDKGFLRSLTDVILEHSLEKTIDRSYMLNRPKLDKCSSLLNHFLDTIPKREEYEVQCLHVVKRKIVELEHPSGCLHDILTCLYDNFALSKEGFFKWRDDADPLEQEGKGVALRSCQPFIKFLKESKDDETSEDEN